MFPAPISLFNDESKAELGMNIKKYDEEDNTIFCSLKVTIEPADKDSKTYIVKFHKYDTGTPEEFLKWQMTFMEQIKATGYGGKYDIAKLPQPKLRQPTYAHIFQCAKLPQPKLRQSTDVQRSQHTLRATQVRCALVRAYVELLQNRPLMRLL
jgi:hypothetical protein